jgi:murein DD-endopeptidase
MINWKKIFEVEAEQFKKMTEQEKFIYFLLLQYRSPYLWGKELPDGADCSGSVCLALAAAIGKIVRTTADELYRKFFTVKNPGVTDIQAVFFIAQYDRPHGDRVLRTGEVGHVTGVIAEGVVMNVVEPKGDIRLISSLRNSYSLRGFDMEIRGLDRKAFVAAADAGTTLFGLDTEFAEYIDTGKEKAEIW